MCTKVAVKHQSSSFRFLLVPLKLPKLMVYRQRLYLYNSLCRNEEYGHVMATHTAALQAVQEKLNECEQWNIAHQVKYIRLQLWCEECITGWLILSDRCLIIINFVVLWPVIIKRKTNVWAAVTWHDEILGNELDLHNNIADLLLVFHVFISLLGH